LSGNGVTASPLTTTSVPKPGSGTATPYKTLHLPNTESAAVGGATAQPKPKKETKMHNVNELLARQQEIEARKAELDNEYAGMQFTPEAQDEFALIDAEWDTIEETKKNIAYRAALLEKKSGNASKADGAGATSANAGKIEWAGRSNVRTNNLPDNPFDLAAYRTRANGMDEITALYREGATRINDGLTYESNDQAGTKAHVERLLARDTDDGRMARRVIHTGSPLYDKAFGKQLLGHNLTTQEQATLSEGGIGASTLPVPITIDPTVILTNNGVRNPLRALARNVSITGMTWTGISSDGVTASYDAELAEVSDDSPTFSAPTATVASARAFVPFSIELDQDWGNLRTELTRMFVDSKDTLEATKFLTGTGTAEPLGILTALTTGSGTASIVSTAGTAAIALADLNTVSNALPPRFDANAEWLASKAIYAAFNTLTSSRTDFWTTIGSEAGSPKQLLLGYPTNQLSTMSSVYTASSYVAILGDFSQFVIIDRVGMNVELIPHLFHTSNNRPYGARGLWAMWRNTSQVTTYKAFKVLKALA
jgi:HK97 family phage major capsid protein